MSPNQCGCLFCIILLHRKNVHVAGIVGSKDEQKYSSLTLGSVIGIRRPRVTNTQNSCGNLTLDQLNPTLAEALAAMKSKSDAVVSLWERNNYFSAERIRAVKTRLRPQGPSAHCRKVCIYSYFWYFVQGKGNGYIGSHGGADGLCRRDSLPTRMSGPVKLESLSSTSQCGTLKVIFLPGFEVATLHFSQYTNGAPCVV